MQGPDCDPAVVAEIRAAVAEYRECFVGYARLVAERDRLRDLPLRAGLDLVAAGVRDWSGGDLQDDVSLRAVERIG